MQVVDSNGFLKVRLSGVSDGITIGTTAITSGTVGRVLFEGTGNVVQESANLFWDNTNGRLGIGTSSPSRTLDIAGNQLITSADVANPDVGPPAFNIFNGTFSKFNVVYDAAGCRVNMLGTSTQGLRINTGSSTNFSTIGGGGLTFSCSTNNFQIISASVLFNVAGSERARFAPSTGNLLINTTTDAGFRLDVNGTARVSSTLTVSGQTGSGGINSIISTNNDLSLACGYYFRFRATNDSNAIIFGSDWDGTQTYLYSNRRMVFGAALINASAILQADSTTRGFLPPRMTTTQKNAIATPAAGLVVYDTTLNKLCVRAASAWETITSI